MKTVRARVWKRERQRRNLYVSLLSALTTNLSPSLKICMEKFKVHGLTGVAESGGGVFFFFFFQTLGVSECVLWFYGLEGR